MGNGYGPDTCGPNSQEAIEDTGKCERDEKQRHDEKWISRAVVKSPW